MTNCCLYVGKKTNLSHAVNNYIVNMDTSSFAKSQVCVWVWSYFYTNSWIIVLPYTTILWFSFWKMLLLLLMKITTIYGVHSVCQILGFARYFHKYCFIKFYWLSSSPFKNEKGWASKVLDMSTSWHLVRNQFSTSNLVFKACSLTAPVLPPSSWRVVSYKLLLPAFINDGLFLSW